MKILLIGDAGCHTGFARANHGLGDRLATTYGHEVSALATNFRGDHYDTPMHLYVPTMLDRGDTYGRSRIIEILDRVQPDIVWMTGDPPVLINHIFHNQFDPKMILLQIRPIVTYQARDGSNPPKTWQALGQVPGKDGPVVVSRQVAMSKFGQEQMDGADLVYHGLDTDIFHPVSSQNPIILDGKRITSKRDAKEAIGYPPDSFLVLRVDRNDWRKDYGSSLKALAPLIAKHDDIYVHLHCMNLPSGEGGVHIVPLLSRLDIPPGRVKMPDVSEKNSWEGWSLDRLVTLYNAADVFISTAMGEGFGFGPLEALGCGVPVIAQNVSAIPEVVGEGGILIQPAFEVTAPGGQDMYAADIGAFTEAIEHLYLNQGFRKRYAKAGLAHVTNTFNWDVEAEKFESILRDVVENTPLVEATA